MEKRLQPLHCKCPRCLFNNSPHPCEDVTETEIALDGVVKKKDSTQTLRSKYKYAVWYEIYQRKVVHHLGDQRCLFITWASSQWPHRLSERNQSYLGNKRPQWQSYTHLCRDALLYVGGVFGCLYQWLAIITKHQGLEAMKTKIQRHASSRRVTG